MGVIKDITGQKFNHLTAIKWAGGQYWHFLCDCGRYKKIHKKNVVSGRVKACGCLLRSGKKYQCKSH